jgi:hypothetical protein
MACYSRTFMVAQPPGDWVDPAEQPAPASQRVQESTLAPVPGLAAAFLCETDGLARVYGQVSFQLQGCSSPLGRVMLNVQLRVNGNRVTAGTVTENMITGEHYHVSAFAIAIPLSAGRHTVEVSARWNKKGGSEGCWVYYKERHYSALFVEVYGAPFIGPIS